MFFRTLVAVLFFIYFVSRFPIHAVFAVRTVYAVNAVFSVFAVRTFLALFSFVSFSVFAAVGIALLPAGVLLVFLAAFKKKKD